MSRPVWRLEWATDYSALYIDETGVYAPELEILEEVFDAPDDQRFLVFSASIERQKVVTETNPDGSVTQWLVPEAYKPEWRHPISSYPEWYVKHLADVATSCGIDSGEEEIREELCSDDPSERARAYESIAAHFGWENFDSYPLTISTKQADNWPDWRKEETDDDP